jgi:hypothetical protein
MRRKIILIQPQYKRPSIFSNALLDSYSEAMKLRHWKRYKEPPSIWYHFALTNFGLDVNLEFWQISNLKSFPEILLYKKKERDKG